ncbi:hydroxyacid dehydrogenase [Falsiroseomonas bella]|uniref:Hydroxyacid dehydrogenase n=1 Tax=Falsiroseomonas bella TaxID=2184016 RepID=A0A317FFP0_9PROT|nr:D-2-hydroxyacid dehydrogenase [Falsiroseomonas bella]PWS37894.1 hydroxyacid dehydrogenase [Falsiroseomonas bella]
MTRDRVLRVHAHVSPKANLADQFTEAKLRAALAPLAQRLALSHGGTQESLEAALADAEVLFLTGSAPLHDLARRAPHLRWISYTSAGVEGLLKLDIPAHVTITNASGTHAPKAAEFALAAVLMLNNAIPHLVTAQRAHRWSPRAGGTVAGKTVLILGMGALGGAAARALKAQGMRVIGNSRSGRAHPDVDVMTAGGDFRRHLPEADFLIIALPLTPETHGLVGRAELDALPRHAGVVNIGRGEQLDEGALAAKLHEGSLSGAVLDALTQEPLPADSPLWDTPNLIITAHCGVYDPTAYGTRCMAAFAANIQRYLDDAALEQVVQRDRGY